MTEENENNFSNQEDENDNSRNLEDSSLTDENVILNEGEEEDRLMKKDKRHKLNQKNKMENNKNEKQAKNVNMPNKNDKYKHPKLNEDNKMNHPNKTNKKKIQDQAEYLYGEEKNNNDGNNATNELFKKALKKNSNKGFPLIEFVNEKNTLSTKITESLYDKYVGQNIKKSKHLDIYSKIKDEEIRQGREATRTKQDVRKINDMIERQEDYEKLKSNKKKGRQREIKNKINEECKFIPNGKKNISSRTPNDFYIDQKKFIEKKEEIINQMTQKILDTETKNANAVLISKNSEKLANSKNPDESREDFCKRLAQEKLKSIKRVLEAPREEKKLTKKELKDLTDKLHKEGETFKKNRKIKEQEQIDKMKKLEKNDFVLQKSKKVLFDKFISIYGKTLNDLFNKKGNFQINYDEYKNVLNSLGFIKSYSNNENLVKESFNSLKPQDDKIDTYSFLIFALAALGIYKGNDEKIEQHSSKVTMLKKEEGQVDDNQRHIHESNNIINTNNSININNMKKKNQNKTSSELIKSNLPNLDLEKYGFSGKECKIIKTKYMPFVSGISESWAKDLFKKKQERKDKLEENKRNILEDNKKLENKRKEDRIVDSFLKKVLENELSQDNNDINNEKSKYSKNNNSKSFKVEDMYEILQKKKQRELDSLKAKQEEDIQQKCTFQPNSKTKPVNKKEVAKNIEKLYIEGKNSYLRKKQQGDKDPDLNSENEKNCTFKPVIKDYKGNYFENNPLKKDKSFNYEIKKKEKIREEKGYTNKEIKKYMSFGIEPKSNKEDIYKRVIPNRAEKIIGNIQNDFIGYTNFDDEGNKNILKIEINLENKKKELLIIYPEDDYIKVVDDFCNKHELNEEKKIRLIRVIKDKIRKNEN